MKTHNETFASVMEKVDEYDKNKKKQRKNAAKIGISAFAVCLLGAAAVFALTNAPAAVPNDTNTVSAVTETSTAESLAGDTGKGDDMPIMPGGANPISSDGANGGNVSVPQESSMPAAEVSEADTQVPNTEPDSLFNGVEQPTVWDANGAFIPYSDTDTPGTVDYITLIRDYPGVEGKYMAPAKGDVIISLPLSAAMKEYGDDMTEYYVRIDVIGGATRTPAEEKALCEAEMERLTKWVKENNYTDRVGIDEYGSIGDESDHVYTLFAHCSTNFVNYFPASSEYGYFLSLYDEYDSVK